MANREEMNRAAGLPEGFEHHGSGAAGPLYQKPGPRARLLLQLEDREPVAVCTAVAVQLGDVWHFPEPPLGMQLSIDAALTTEARDL